MSFTKNPMNPIVAKPTAVAWAKFMNSLASGFLHFKSSRVLSSIKVFIVSTAYSTGLMLMAFFILERMDISKLLRVFE